MQKKIKKLRDTFYQTALSTAAKVEYLLKKEKLKNRAIWIISETENQAQDNGYYFFKYLREKFPEKEIYYLIGKEAPRVKELEKLQNILYLGEYKSILYILSAKYILSTHGLWMLPSEFGLLRKFTKKMITAKKIWLGHGITAMKNGYAVYNKRRFSLNDFLVAGSEFEKNIFVEEYGYSEKEVLVTGFPRYDDMESDLNDKIILFMPTWRDKQDNLGEEFLKTEFYTKVMSLLRNEELQSFLREKQVKIYLYLHENFQKYNSYFYNAENENIKVIKNKEKNVKELLKMSSCLISDYSSVIFDFAYMNKPVISYQFDYEKYINSREEKPFVDIKTEIPAMVTESEKEIVEFLKDVVRRDFSPLENQQKCLKKYFKYTDDKNCKRLYEEILKLN